MTRYFTLFILFALPYGVIAQTFSADTALAYDYYREAISLRRTNSDSALLLFQQAEPIFQTHALHYRFAVARWQRMQLYYGLGLADSSILTGKVTVPFFDEEGLRDSLKIQYLILRTIGSAYELKQEYELALTYYQKSLLLIKKHKAKSLSTLVRGYLHVGQMEAYLGNFKAARRTLEIAIPLTQELLPSYSANVLCAYIYRELSNACSAQTDYEAAKNYLITAEPYYLAAFAKRPAYAAEVYQKLGNLLGDMYEFEEALQSYQRAIPMYMADNNESKRFHNLAMTYYNLAVTYFDLGDHNVADSLCQKSLTIRQKHFPENQGDIADNLNLIANLKLAKDSIKLALPLYYQSIVLRKKTYGESSLHTARSYNNLGITYTLLKQSDSALHYLNQALTLKKRHYKKRHDDIALTLENFGLLYKQKQPDSAAYYYHQAAKQLVESFHSNKQEENPNPEEATLSLKLVIYLQQKGQSLFFAGKQKEALSAYATAAESARVALQKARREADKILIAEISQSMYEEAALLHFLRGK